jgi:hypothetical protein
LTYGMQEPMNRQIQIENAETLSSEAAQPSFGNKVTFSFGQKWQDFVERYLNPERERIAIASLVEFLERRDLKNLDFLAIGCGSGLFSLAAIAWAPSAL